LEKSISNRFYFDYNATSPLSIKVQDFLRSGDFLFGNPSSLHQDGKSAKKRISETSSYLFSLFKLTETQFRIVYHSGASEGINAFFKGIALDGFIKKERYSFYFSSVDHACVYNQKEFLESFGHEVIYFSVNQNGEFNCDQLINEIQQKEKIGLKTFLNFTVVNNETGVVWPFALAEKIKRETKTIIHVDAVQLVGKIKQWNDPSDLLDAYTFSGHKFGSLKGVGFSFISKNINLVPLISGGNQQNGLRSGTENALGIYSIKLALNDINEHFDADKSQVAIKYLSQEITNLVGNKGEIVAFQNKSKNLNTIFLILFNQKSDIISARFDLAGISVSTGSACSSGIIKENRILMNMGYTSIDSKSAIRFSFDPNLDLDRAKAYFLEIKKVLDSIL
jgi:cysteine desulfurase